MINWLKRALWRIKHPRYICQQCKKPPTDIKATITVEIHGKYKGDYLFCSPQCIYKHFSNTYRRAF
jgi:hypothetical protein